MGSNDIVVNNVMNVCRLCLGTESLIWVFDNRIEIPNNIKDVVQITTGVTISPTDCVSQMLCSKCLHITIKMFKFRSSSIVNDMELKAKAAVKQKCCLDKSVESVLSKYPKIILPSSVTKCDIAPKVLLSRNEVTMWFKSYQQLEKRKQEELELVAGKLLEDEYIDGATENHHEYTNRINENKTYEAAHILEELSENSSSKVLETNAVPSLTQGPLSVRSFQQSVEVASTSSKCSENLEQFSDTTQRSDTLEAENQLKRKSVDSVSPKPKKFKSHSENSELDNLSKPLVTLKYVTKSLFVCNICNGILYSAKDLQKHKTKHMKCILCKQRFRTMEETESHRENNCIIKNIMENLPTIFLHRCDQLKDICERYPMAFNFSSKKDIQNVVMIPGSDSQCCEDKLLKSVPMKETTVTSDPICQISLISDDEDEKDLSGISRAANHTSSGNSSTDVLSVEPIEGVVEPCTLVDRINAKPSINAMKVVVSSSSSSSIRPDIQIFGEDILDVNLDDNDTSLLKNILTRTRKNYKETGIQTDMPSNIDIVAFLNKDKLFELKKLREHLNYYKIPVNISYSSQYSVRYGYEPSPTFNKDRSWNKIKIKLPAAPKRPVLKQRPFGFRKQKRPTVNDIVPTNSKVDNSRDNSYERPVDFQKKKPSKANKIVPTNSKENTSKEFSSETPVGSQKEKLSSVNEIVTSNSEVDTSKDFSSADTIPIFVIQKTPQQISVSKLQNSVPVSSTSTEVSTNNSTVPTISPITTKVRGISTQPTNHTITNLKSYSRPTILNYSQNNFPQQTPVSSKNMSFQLPEPNLYSIHNNNIHTNNVTVGVTNRAALLPSTNQSVISLNNISVSAVNTMTLLNNFVPHRSTLSVPKQNQNIAVSSLPKEVDSPTTSTSTSTGNDGTTYMPVIRVKSVAELT